MSRRYIAKREDCPADARAIHRKRLSVAKALPENWRYEDGQLGEVFLNMHKEALPGSASCNCSFLGLQHGVPLEEYVEAFVFTHCEPNGMVQGNDAIKVSTSIIVVFHVGHHCPDRTDRHTSHQKTYVPVPCTLMVSKSVHQNIMTRRLSLNEH